MPPIVVAEAVLDAVKARLDLIVAGPDYNTSPTAVQIGVPRDAVPEGTATLLVYLTHTAAETNFAAAAPAHAERTTYHIWCISGDPVDGRRVVLRLVRDVQKAIRSGFAAIAAAGVTSGLALPGYMRDEEMERITGGTAYVFTFTADWTIDLTA